MVTSSPSRGVILQPSALLPPDSILPSFSPSFLPSIFHAPGSREAAFGKVPQASRRSRAILPASITARMAVLRLSPKALRGTRLKSVGSPSAYNFPRWKTIPAVYTMLLARPATGKTAALYEFGRPKAGELVT